jgi:hypothetical protein
MSQAKGIDLVQDDRRVNAGGRALALEIDCGRRPLAPGRRGLTRRGKPRHAGNVRIRYFFIMYR